MLSLELRDSLPHITGSADLCTQLFMNLLSNANAHTRNGKIVLATESSDGVIRITVSDNGEGVNPSIAHRIFERGISGRGGTGIGLPLCRTITEAHGGTIKLDSTPGQGTTVTIILPVLI